jgi:hypothetical protein
MLAKAADVLMGAIPFFRGPVSVERMTAFSRYMAVPMRNRLDTDLLYNPLIAPEESICAFMANMWTERAAYDAMNDTERNHIIMWQQAVCNAAMWPRNREHCTIQDGGAGPCVWSGISADGTVDREGIADLYGKIQSISRDYSRTINSGMSRYHLRMRMLDYSHDVLDYSRMYVQKHEIDSTLRK